MKVKEAIRLLKFQDPEEEILISWWDLEWAMADNINATAESWTETIQGEETLQAYLGGIVAIEVARDANRPETGKAN